MIPAARYRLEIHIRKRLLGFLGISCLFFLFAGITFFFFFPGESMSSLPFMETGKEVGVFMMIFSLIFGAFFIRTFRNSRGPEFVINELGIWKKGPDLPKNRILWENMVSARVLRIEYMDLILFKINNAAEVIASEPSALKRKALAYTIKTEGSPLAIHATLSGYNTKALCELILQKYKEATSYKW